MRTRTVIITGGSGYLGRCIAHGVHHEGYQPVLVDNFSTSSRPTDCPFPIHEVELCDLAATNVAWSRIGEVHAVFHFAARALVSESCIQPELYLRNNVLATLNVAEASLTHGIRHIVHSSSCAVYGIPSEVPITEAHPTHPITPYGESKLIGEQMLNQLARFRGLRVMNLRYFNPAGALESGQLGESHVPETHLIPNVVRAAAQGKAIPVHGTDYPTQDGTCVRDYIHVEDLAHAHLRALRYLENPDNPLMDAVNIGGGRGTSVKQVVQAAERVFQKQLPVQSLPRRQGDPPVLVADTSLSRKILEWTPRLSVEDMIRSHLQWETFRLK